MRDDARSSSSGLIRLWALETRGALSEAKSHCRNCGKPIVWMTTVANAKRVPIDGHHPVALQTAIDRETGHTIEFHDRGTVHFETCEKRAARKTA